MKHLKPFNEGKLNKIVLTNDEVVEIDNLLNIARDEGVSCDFDIENDVESKKSEFGTNMIELYRYDSSYKMHPKSRENPNVITSDEFVHIIDNITTRLDNMGDFKTSTRLYFTYQSDVKSLGRLNRKHFVFNSVRLNDVTLFKEEILKLAQSDDKYKEVIIDTVIIEGALILFTKA